MFAACRSEPKGRATVAGIVAVTGNPAVAFLSLDLADLASVRRCAGEFLALGQPLHVLINNAGVGGQRGITADGFELAFGVNHLGHFALTAALMDRLAHPWVRLHLDVKAMSSEAKPVPDVIREFAPWMRHFHANDANRRGPGFGETDFVPIFRALKDVGYDGWVSVEVFDYTPDPETIARESLRHMRACAARASGAA